MFDIPNLLPATVKEGPLDTLKIAKLEVFITVPPGELPDQTTDRLIGAIRSGLLRNPDAARSFGVIHVGEAERGTVREYQLVEEEPTP